MEPLVDAQTRRTKLAAAAATVPAGRWAVAVSGGADSVALLMLLHNQADLSLHVVHLDHETRNGESAADARFVGDLASRLHIPCTIKRRSEIESAGMLLPRNVSARYRAARMAHFRETVHAHNLQGVILAHHADDQAETILHRLLRGSAPAALGGMSHSISLGGVRVLRPLLEVAGDDLRAFLKEINEPWREDSSNASPEYLRNRLRRFLAGEAELRESLLEIGRASRRLKNWLGQTTPTLQERFAVSELADLPGPMAQEAAMRWLADRGAPHAELTRLVGERLLLMAMDAASVSRQHFPGRLLVCRRRGMIFIEPPAKPDTNR